MTTRQETFYDEIDLKPYIKLALGFWKWLVVLSVLAGVVAAIFAVQLPSVYEAKALVVITDPRFDLNFDARFSANEEVSSAYRVYPELAVSDELVKQLFDKLDDPPGSQMALRNMLSAENGRDPSLIQLTVRTNDSDYAVTIVNEWAMLFVRMANSVLGAQGENTLDFVQERLDAAETELNRAEAQLVEFQARNRKMIVTSQLEAALALQEEYLLQQSKIALLLEDAEGLREQLDGEGGAAANQLLLLLIQAKAFNLESTLPAQFQITDSETIFELSQDEQQAALETLMGILTERTLQIQTALDELEPQILELQRSLGELEAEERQFTNKRDVAQETYLSLAHAAQEATITSQEMSGKSQLASRATSALLANSLSPALAAVLGALGTLVAGMLVIFVSEWWRKE